MLSSSENSNRAAWEISKENIQPLSGGRKMSSLSTSILEENEPTIDKTMRDTLKTMEDAITTYNGPDALEPWIKFIGFLQQHQLSETGEYAAKFRETLIKCIRRFMNQPEYKNDKRFMDIYLKSIEKQVLSKKITLLVTVMNHGFGTRVSKVYIALAELHEANGDQNSALKVIREGLAKNADPKDVLIEFEKNLEFRMAAKIAMAMKQDNESAPVRLFGAGVPLDHEFQAPSVRTFLSPARAAKALPVSKKIEKVSIGSFDENGDTNASTNSVKADLVQEMEMIGDEAENVPIPTKWNENGTEMSEPMIKHFEKIDVYVSDEEDENCAMPVPLKPPKAVLAERKLDEVADFVEVKLTVNPVSEAPSIQQAPSYVDNSEISDDVFRHSFAPANRQSNPIPLFQPLFPQKVFEDFPPLFQPSLPKKASASLPKQFQPMTQKMPLPAPVEQPQPTFTNISTTQDPLPKSSFVKKPIPAPESTAAGPVVQKSESNAVKTSTIVAPPPPPPPARNPVKRAASASCLESEMGSRNEEKIKTVSMYRKHQLFRGCREISFEQLRAEEIYKDLGSIKNVDKLHELEKEFQAYKEQSKLERENMIMKFTQEQEQFKINLRTLMGAMENMCKKMTDLEAQNQTMALDLEVLKMKVGSGNPGWSRSVGGSFSAPAVDTPPIPDDGDKNADAENNTVDVRYKRQLLKYAELSGSCRQPYTTTETFQDMDGSVSNISIDVIPPPEITEAVFPNGKEGNFNITNLTTALNFGPKPIYSSSPEKRTVSNDGSDEEDDFGQLRNLPGMFTTPYVKKNNFNQTVQEVAQNLSTIQETSKESRSSTASSNSSHLMATNSSTRSCSNLNVGTTFIRSASKSGNPVRYYNNY